MLEPSPNMLALALTAAGIVIVAGGAAAIALRMKARRRLERERLAAIDRIETLVAIRKAWDLDNVPPVRPMKHNPGPGLRPHPLRTTAEQTSCATPWVIPPASLFCPAQAAGIGDIDRQDSDTRAAAVITTLCMPADVASVPSTGD